MMRQWRGVCTVLKRRSKRFAFAAIVLLACAGGVASAQQIIPLPALNHTPADTLPVLIGGTTPGVEHDQYQVSGSTRLEGRLDLTLINGYEPQAGDSVDFLLSESDIELDFRSHFLRVPLPAGVAVDLQRFASGYAAQFTDIGPVVDFVANNTNSQWNGQQAPVWSTLEPPTSVNPVVIANNTPDGPQFLQVFGGPASGQPSARAHSIEIRGQSNAEMIVNIAQGGALSASDFVSVGPNAVVNLGTTGQLLSNEVAIRRGGRVAMNDSRIVSGPNSTVVEGELLGNGTVEGTLRLQSIGRIEIGTAIGETLAVEGDYTQTGGTLEIDARGTAIAEKDRLLVSNTATLGGRLRVDLSQFSSFATAGPVEIISAGAIAGNGFDVVETVGFSVQGFYAGASYTPTTVALQAYSVGDMNRDGFVDELDVDFFALALRDRRGYETYMLGDGTLIGISGDITGDTDYDGDLDFDDIDDMISLLPPPAALYAQTVLLGIAVPEPPSMLLALVGGVAICARRWR
jgi:hypothetical protein